MSYMVSIIETQIVCLYAYFSEVNIWEMYSEIDYKWSKCTGVVSIAIFTIGKLTFNVHTR